MTDVRVVEVDKYFLSQLKEYLRPEERWIKEKDGRIALIMFTMTGEDTRELLFVRKDEV